jgi:hypothetical protein
MQSDSGLLRWLKVPFLYSLFQGAVGGNALRRRVIQDRVRAKAGDKVIDIGCGPAEALQCLPDVICQTDARQQGHFRGWRHALGSWGLAI